MTKFLVRRSLIAIPTLVGISLVLFAIIAMAPGDPFSDLAQNPNVLRNCASVRRQLGLDDPVLIQYGRWVTSMARGNWGVSFSSHVPVLDLVWARLPTTLFVVGSSYLVAFSSQYPPA